MRADTCGLTETELNVRSGPTVNHTIIYRYKKGVRVCGDPVKGGAYSACGAISAIWLAQAGGEKGYVAAACVSGKIPS